jgi:murein DD-endopeptidase MepM/ murein hydrolase activator NlpD
MLNEASRITDHDPAGDDETGSPSLAPYFKNAAKFAPPTKQEIRKKRVLARVRGLSDRYDEWKLKAGSWFARADLTPDLAENIGSGRWFRGVGTMVALGAVALAFWPDLTPLEARPAMPTGEDIQDELRSQMITPLALGADSGRRMGPTQFVTPLKSAPERPQIELVATLADGDSFASMLRRAGVSGDDISRVSALVGGAMALSEIEPGTKMDIVLGRRPAAGVARPLDSLAFRARFDLELAINRRGEGPESPLVIERKAIRVDSTPLRVRGRVGTSLYRSMRAAGVPANAVQAYLQTLTEHIDMDRDLRADDEFDVIVSYRRAATGERETGELLFAGIDRAGKPRTQLVRWGSEGRFFEASGVGEQKRGLLSPVNGAVGSGFGMRRHPILGYRRMHSGLDFRAGYGTPIVAVTDGQVISAGRAGGCGIAVKISHAGGIQTRYCHMSQMAVSSGQSVRRGQVIGYVGSTGLSTGPHLHYEMYRGGVAINPASVSYVNRAQLEGSELANFRARLASLRQIETGAALKDLVPTKTEISEPKREIEKVDSARRVN